MVATKAVLDGHPCLSFPVLAFCGSTHDVCSSRAVLVAAQSAFLTVAAAVETNLDSARVSPATTAGVKTGLPFQQLKGNLQSCSGLAGVTASEWETALIAEGLVVVEALLQSFFLIQLLLASMTLLSWVVRVVLISTSCLFF